MMLKKSIEKFIFEPIETLETRARRWLPPRLRLELEFEWNDRAIVAGFVVLCIIVFTQRFCQASQTSLAFFINALAWNNVRKVDPNIVQLVLCLLVGQLLFPPFSAQSIVFHSLGCALYDNHLFFSALKIVLVSPIAKWRLSLFTFVLLVIPLQGFGQRAFVVHLIKEVRKQTSRFILNRKRSLDIETSLFIWMLPTAFVIAIYLETSSFPHEEYVHYYSAALFFIGVFGRLCDDQVDRFFLPSPESAIRYPVEKQKEMDILQRQSEQAHFRLLASVSSFGFGALIAANGNYVLAVPFFVMFYLSLLDFEYPRKVVGSRSILTIQFFTILVAIIFLNRLTGQPLVDNLIFFFSLSRGLAASCHFSFERLSTFISDGAFTTGFLIFFSRYPFANAFVFFVSNACFFIEAFTRLSGKKLILKEREAQNFLDHAIKQKFAGTGTALEIALADEVFRKSISAETLRVLHVASSECQLGSFLCHEATLKRQILDGTFVPKSTSRRLSSILDEWRENWKEVDMRASERNAEQWIVADWVMIYQVFQGLFCRSQHRDRSFHAVLTITVPTRKTMTINVEMIKGVYHATQTQTCELFAECLGGVFSYKGKSFRLTLPVSLGEQQSSTMGWSPSETTEKLRSGRRITRSSRRAPSPEQSSMADTVPELPTNLVFAVLDDSAMIRVNLKITLQKAFNASVASVVHGETEEQALEFVSLCMKLKPDIVILDENLDYTAEGGSLILGSGVADDLRTAGYRGVIVIHSANELLRESLDHTIVDGFIMKGANRILIRNELARILALKRQER